MTALLQFQGYAPFQLPKYIRVGEGGEPKTLASFAKILAEVIEQFVTVSFRIILRRVRHL